VPGICVSVEEVGMLSNEAASWRDTLLSVRRIEGYWGSSASRERVRPWASLVLMWQWRLPTVCGRCLALIAIIVGSDVSVCDVLLPGEGDGSVASTELQACILLEGWWPPSLASRSGERLCQRRCRMEWLLMLVTGEWRGEVGVLIARVCEQKCCMA
jgi:hypothetical protein